MQLEPALTERRWSGHGRGNGVGSSKAWRARLEESAALLAPVALIAGLALAGGGFDVTARHIAGLAAWLVVVSLLVLGAASRAALGRPFFWTVGLIGGLSLLSAMSSLWSGSVELSVIEADRVLAYLGFFVAAFLLAQTDQTRQRFAEGLTIALVAVAVLGLASRLLPDLVQVANSLGSGPRLRYPLGYWNANGAVLGVGVALLLWASRHALWSGLRLLAAAALPAMLLALYFTYSRGGLLALLIASGVTIALSRDRLWLLATLGAGALGALPAVLAVQGRRALADNIDSQAAVDQGLTVLLVLLAGIALTLALFGALRWLERRGGGLTGRAVELSRDPRVLRGAAATLAVVAIAAVAAIGGRAWDQFTSSDLQFPDQPERHFSDLSGAGRGDFYRVALEAFGERPVLGAGAGAYEFAWERRRSIDHPVHDAHSLYLEAFAELGAVGGLLVLALVGAILWLAFRAWRAARPAQRELYAVLLGVLAALAVGMGFDWFWEIAAVGAVFFLAAAVAVSARSRQLSRPSLGANGYPEEEGEGQRFGLAVAGLAVAWIAAVALIGPLLVEREIEASQRAAASEDYVSALNHAENARSIEPFAASPYVQLGLLAEAQGDYDAAARRFTQAIDREERNWQLYFLRSRVERAGGDIAAARADLRRARRLNPRAPELQAGQP